MFRRSIAVVLTALGMLLIATAAQADTQDIIQPQNETPDQGFQAGTCTVNKEPETPTGTPCSPTTPSFFYKTAGGHPPKGFTQYTIEHEPYEPNPAGWPTPSLKAEIPGADIKEHTIKTLRTDLPPGLTVNPEATPTRCTLAQFLTKVGPPGEEKFVPACDPETQVGEDEITLVTNKAGAKVGESTIPFQWFVIPPTPEATKVKVFNLVPSPGEPAKLGFVVNGAVPIFLETQVAWESDFHESFTIKLVNTAEISGLSTLISRLVSFGSTAGNDTYLTTPTTCFDPNEAQYEHLYSTWFRAESYAAPDAIFPNGSTAVEATVPRDPAGTGPLVKQEGCDTIPFEPTLDVNPGTTQVDSPAPATVEAKLPFDPVKEGGAAQVQSNVRKAEVTLPTGIGLNPSGAVGLTACTDAQFKKGVRVYANECPASSIIGTAEVVSHPLSEPLEGNVYVGEQKSGNPASGDLFRILIEAKSEKEGIAARLVGNVKASPTGELTAVLNDKLTGQLAGPLPEGLPQAPFESVKLHFDGSKQTLTSPATCSAEEASGQLEPWARPGSTAPVSSKFTLSSDPGGGSCPQALAQRKFAPSYTAATDQAKAGSYSPFRVRIARPDGQQELKLVDVTLPKGLVGKLAGIPYCPEDAINAATEKTGQAELAAPSCSAASQIGTTTTAAGTGGTPLQLPGKVYLAGSLRGSTLSLAVITPAVAGPYDLGTVVVRVPVNVDPLTAQVNPVSDELPNVFGGVKLDLRSIDFNIDRPQFMINPTNCAAQATSGAIDGGGANPFDPAAWSSYAVSAPFKATGCNKLAFKPKLHTRLYGPTTRAKNPRIRAVLEAGKGNANIARAALTLPHSLFLDNSHIKTVCTRPDLAAHTCPKSSIYGHAEAITPLLDKKLKGKVYLVPGGHELPDLVADLRGQVEIQLHGVISSKRGGLKTVFNNTPDVPVTKFILNMQGGEKSLLVNSTNICKGKQLAVLNLKGQNGKKVVDNQYPLNISSCGGKKK
ncbi:MAG: hypothetical protein ACOYD4_15550 [Solirubrobacterales bacterium]